MSDSKRETVLRLAILAFGFAALTFSSVAIADTYTYDALGRLTGVTYADGSSISYAYDSAGNRTTVTQTVAP
jgi:YD repeat-containing protein